MKAESQTTSLFIGYETKDNPMAVKLEIYKFSSVPVRKIPLVVKINSRLMSGRSRPN